MTPTAPLIFDSIVHARQVQSIIHKAWWEAYLAKARLRLKEGAPIEAERVMANALKRVTDSAIAQFGNDQGHPGCQECLHHSVFGGPRHEASRGCESGKKPHCSCPMCWG
jgi:hypothetical protein